jgi:ATP-independent RNA helicase DbpA
LNDTRFSTLKLHAALQSNLTSLGYQQTTPVQALSLPAILAGRDVIAQANTGSGKTAAFGLGLLQQLDVARFDTQALVLCPTRELADQVAKEIRRLGRAIANIKVLTLCGGVPLYTQINSLARAPHIAVGTPGRVEELLRKGHLRLEQLQTLVLDEADRMLDMGFQDALDAIIGFVPARRQTLLFSATYPEQIEAVANRVMIDPVRVAVPSDDDTRDIKEHYYQLEEADQRLTALKLLLLSYRPESALVFCNTKIMTREVANELCEAGFSAMALHGDLDQRIRDQTLERFANRSISILVATDVAARGLDISDLDAVINYFVAHDSEVHFHRIGRTGRAGKKGLAFTLIGPQEKHKLTRLEQELDYRVAPQRLPAMEVLNEPAYQPQMETLQIDAGKKQKIRAGDVLGALTGEKGIDGKTVGKISVGDKVTYVAVANTEVRAALKKLNDGKLKGRSYRARWLRRQ